MKEIIITVLIFFLVNACNKVDDIINSDQYDPPEIEEIGASHRKAIPGDTIMVWVKATNPEEGLLSFNWQGSGGRYIEPADKDTAYWIAPLQGGNYELKVTVSNEKKNKFAVKIVNVISAEKPLVNILEPAAGTYFVQGQEIMIKAEAYHDNGLQQVVLFVKSDSVKAVDQNNSNLYEFTVQTNSGRVGQIWLKVLAKVNNENYNADSVYVFVEGILPKTGGN